MTTRGVGISYQTYQGVTADAVTPILLIRTGTGQVIIELKLPLCLHAQAVSARI